MTDAHARIRARILSSSLPDDAYLVELDGKEAISELFNFTVTLRVPAHAAVDSDKVVGSRATIVFEELIGDKNRPLRRIHGVIHRCQDLLRTGDARAYRIQVVPRLWLSTLVETLDIFQDQSVVDIVQRKLGQLHLSTDDDREVRLQNTYRRSEFTVQYKETDFAFVSRLTEHLGISFVFEHGDEVEKVVLVDDAAGFAALPEPIPYTPGHNQGGVFDLVADSQIVPSNFYVRDYNYRNPGVDLMAEDSFEGFGGGVVEYGGHFKDPDEGKFLASVRRQEKECRRRIYRGEGADPRISAGRRTSISGHPSGDIELLPIAVEHHLTQSDFTAREDGAPSNYRCRFEATAAALTFRPERRTPKPRVTGMVTGIVDGTGSDEYADIDQDGRYRVRFMFDTSGAGEGKASRPVRMMQPHAGGGFGMHFPLRRGTEVLITFIDGDPDRPIICGTVPNPQTPSPVAAGNNRRNIIRTGGNNEINIDDTKGSERIKLSTPHEGTVFQIGAPNAPEDGAALQTLGAFTTVAASGSGTVGAMSTSLQALTTVKLAGSIVSEAKPIDSTKLFALGLTVVAQLATAALKVAELAKAAVVSLDRLEHQMLVDEQREATQEWEAAFKAVASSDSPSGDETEKRLRAAKKEYDVALNARRKSDDAHKASIGLWNDPLQARAQLERKDAAQAEYLTKRSRALTTLSQAKPSANQDPNLRQILERIETKENRVEAQRQTYLRSQMSRNEWHTNTDKIVKVLKAIATGLGTMNALVSYVLAKTTFFKMIERSAERRRLSLEQTRQRRRAQTDPNLRGPLPKSSTYTEPPAPKGLLRRSVKAFTGPPIHSIGSQNATELFGREEVTMWSPKIQLYACDKDGGCLDAFASSTARVTAGKDLDLCGTKRVTVTSSTVDIAALSQERSHRETAPRLVASTTEGGYLQTTVDSWRSLITKDGWQVFRRDPGRSEPNPSSAPHLHLSTDAATLRLKTAGLRIEPKQTRHWFGRWTTTIDNQGHTLCFAGDAGAPDKGKACVELRERRLSMGFENTTLELQVGLGAHLSSDKDVTIETSGPDSILWIKSQHSVVTRGMRIELG